MGLLRHSKGLSPVMATVLIVLMTVLVAASIIPFVLDYTRDNLEESKECFDVLGGVQFVETGFNCYTPSIDDPSNTYTGFSVTFTEETVTGFAISLIGPDGSVQGNYYRTSQPLSGGFQTRRINNDTFVTNAANIALPQVGETFTYVINGHFESAQVAPAVGTNTGTGLFLGNLCDVSDTITFTQCTDQEAIDNVGLY